MFVIQIWPPSFTSVAFIAPTGFPSVKTSYNFSGKYRRMKISIRLSDRQELSLGLITPCLARCEGESWNTYLCDFSAWGTHHHILCRSTKCFLSSHTNWWSGEANALSSKKKNIKISFLGCALHFLSVFLFYISFRLAVTTTQHMWITGGYCHSLFYYLCLCCWRWLFLHQSLNIYDVFMVWSY